MELLSLHCHSESFQQELCLELKNHDAEKLPEEKIWKVTCSEQESFIFLFCFYHYELSWALCTWLEQETRKNKRMSELDKLRLKEKGEVGGEIFIPLIPFSCPVSDEGFFNAFHLQFSVFTSRFCVPGVSQHRHWEWSDLFSWTTWPWTLPGIRGQPQHPWGEFHPKISSEPPLSISNHFKLMKTFFGVLWFLINFFLIPKG